jgi:hypothetical protein
MTTQRTLASRGFVLPSQRPTVGRKDLDRIMGGTRWPCEWSSVTFWNPTFRNLYSRPKFSPRI